ncbi:MAG: hypothetical protein ABI016_14160 [Chthoniobacterales bacterium]
MKAIVYPTRLLQIALISLALALLLGTAGARGELLFADSFDYPKGDLAGNGPPPGSPPGQGEWTLFNGKPSVALFGFQFPGVYSAGKSVILTGPTETNGDKALAELRPVTAADGAVWVGFLMNKARGGRNGYAVVSLGNNVTGPSLGIGMLFERNRYGLDNNTGERGSRSNTDFRPSEEAVWMVTKLDFITGEDYLWVSPMPGVEPDIADADAQLPMTAAFLSSGFSEVVLTIGYTQATFRFDEVRVATTFADLVSPPLAP